MNCKKRVEEIPVMDDIQSIFQMILILFLAVQVERMNHNLRDIKRALIKISDQLKPNRMEDESTEA
jgi:hypothetical protein